MTRLLLLAALLALGCRDRSQPVRSEKTSVVVLPGGAPPPPPAPPTTIVVPVPTPPPPPATAPAAPVPVGGAEAAPAATTPVTGQASSGSTSTTPVTGPATSGTATATPMAGTSSTPAAGQATTGTATEGQATASVPMTTTTTSPPPSSGGVVVTPSPPSTVAPVTNDIGSGAPIGSSGVSPVAGRADGDLRAQIVQSLGEDPGLASAGITVQVSQGFVVLTGNVTSASLKSGAASRAAAIVGADRVRNDIVVR